MKLIGVLCWWEEPVAWLAASVTSMIQHVGIDHLVAVDGAYSALPEGRASSSDDQTRTILELCATTGVGCTLHVPAEPWPGNEIEKRTLAFELAETVAEGADDWFFVLDADETVTSATVCRRILEETNLLVGEARLGVRNWPFGGCQTRKFFRAGQGWHLEGNHYTYVTGEGEVGWSAGTRGVLPAVDCRVEIDHRQPVDTPRRQQQEAYYERRDRLGIERPNETVAA